MAQDGAMADLIDAFARLPSLGRKSATRLAYFILESPPEIADEMARALRVARHSIGHCNLCGNLSDAELCPICRDERRQPDVLCVVEEAREVTAFERTSAFNGLYHVLGGRLSPIDGIGPKELRIDSLLARLDKENISEVIIATNPSVEGETTALYLIDKLRTHHPTIHISRLAQGLPMGADIKYADELTLSRAISGRIDVD